MSLCVFCGLHVAPSLVSVCERVCEIGRELEIERVITGVCVCEGGRFGEFTACAISLLKSVPVTGKCMGGRFQFPSRGKRRRTN